jgi:hypothetical protein
MQASRGPERVAEPRKVGMGEGQAGGDLERVLSREPRCLLPVFLAALAGNLAHGELHRLGLGRVRDAAGPHKAHQRGELPAQGGHSPAGGALAAQVGRDAGIKLAGTGRQHRQVTDWTGYSALHASKQARSYSHASTVRGEYPLRAASIHARNETAADVTAVMAEAAAGMGSDSLMQLCERNKWRLLTRQAPASIP